MKTCLKFTGLGNTALETNLKCTSEEVPLGYSSTTLSTRLLVPDTFYLVPPWARTLSRSFSPCLTSARDV